MRRRSVTWRIQEAPPIPSLGDASRIRCVALSPEARAAWGALRGDDLQPRIALEHAFTNEVRVRSAQLTLQLNLPTPASPPLRLRSSALVTRSRRSASGTGYT